MKHLIFDIETVPDFDGIKKILSIEDSYSNDELLIQFWQKRKPEISTEEAINLFLPLHLHKIVTIGIAISDFDENYFNLVSICDADEKSIIQKFFGGIDKYKTPAPPQIVSWNGGGFDFPVLHHRAMIHNVVSATYWEVGEKRSDFRFNNYLNRYQYRHLDIMDVLANYTPKNFARIDEFAKLCGFPGKKGMDGKDIAKEYSLGNIKKISDYCEVDVVNTYLLYLKFLLISARIDQSAYYKSFERILLWLEVNKREQFWDSIKQNLTNLVSINK